MGGHAFVMAPQSKVVVAMEPTSLAANQDYTGPYVPFDVYEHCSCMIITATSGNTNFNISFDQAKDTAGTGAKTLNFDKLVYSSIDGEGYAETTINGNQHTTGVVTGGRIYMAEFWANNLDIDNDFDHIKVDVDGGDSGVAYTALMIFDHARYKGWDSDMKPVSSFSQGSWA